MPDASRTTGLFVTLEGVEGAGKTTHAAWLARWIEDHGRKVILTREPGGTKAGNEIREILLHGGRDLPLVDRAELLLVFAAREQHTEEVIRPALQRGDVVICDRFTDSTYAYQGGGRGIPVQDIAALESWVQRGLKPDLTFLFDLDPASGLQRTRTRQVPGAGKGTDRFESQDQAFFARVRQSFLEIARREPARVRLIDADRPLDAIQSGLATEMERVLNP